MGILRWEPWRTEIYRGEGNNLHWPWILSLCTKRWQIQLQHIIIQRHWVSGGFYRHTEDHCIFGLWPNTFLSIYRAMISFIHFLRSLCTALKKIIGLWSFSSRMQSIPFPHRRRLCHLLLCQLLWLKVEKATPFINHRNNLARVVLHLSCQGSGCCCGESCGRTEWCIELI